MEALLEAERAIGTSAEGSCRSEAVPLVKGTEFLPIYGHIGRELGKYLSVSLSLSSLLVDLPPTD